MRILIIAVSFFVLINGLYIYFMFEPGYINVWETRYYLFYICAVGITSTFGILRIYNAVVGNTIYLTKVRQELRTFVTSANSIARSSQDYAKTVNPLRSAITKLTNVITLNKKR